MAVHIKKLSSVHTQIHQALSDKLDLSHAAMSARACLVGLLAALSASPDVVDVRFRGPLLPSNAEAKGIIQAGAANNNFPYHDVGLTGVNQVAGVADSGGLLSCPATQYHCMLLLLNGVSGGCLVVQLAKSGRYIRPCICVSISYLVCVLISVVGVVSE